MLAFALMAVVGRTYARFSSFRRILADDVFFYMAAVFLTAGTGILYRSCDPMYLLQAIDTPTQDLLPLTLSFAKLQVAHVALLVGAIFSVKFSFLLFFRHLIWQNKKLMIWWWITVAACIPSAAFVMFSTFVVCHTFDERILGIYSYIPSYLYNVCEQLIYLGSELRLCFRAVPSNCDL